MRHYNETDYVNQVAHIKIANAKLMSFSDFEKLINAVELDSSLFDDDISDTLEFLEEIGAGEVLAIKKLERQYYNEKVRIKSEFLEFGKPINGGDIDNELDEAFFAEREEIVKDIPDGLLREILETEKEVFDIEVRRRKGEKVDSDREKHFNALLQKARGMSFGLAPLYAYLLDKEKEIILIRMILVCKNSGMDSSKIKEIVKKYV